MASTNLFMVTIFLQILITFLIINTCISKNLPSTVLIFGDSTMDTGNNNYIKTILKGNFLPYGQNFPGNVPPTGRFSNGKLVPDFLASALGIKDKVPPFLDPNLSDEELVSGVCFASAGSGWDDLTTMLTRVITADKQIDMFKDYIKRVKGIVGDEKKGMKIINDALVVISAGTNDFGYNFYGVPTRRFQYTVDRYQDFLLLRLQYFVKALYELGCRRMIIAGLPPIGCLPLQMTAKFQNPLDRKCLEDQNSESKAYNDKLSNLINQLQTLLPHSKIVYADIYSPLLDMIQNPKKYGFVETNKGCCGTGLLEVAFLCNPTRPVCQNPSQFIFWDSLHPTQSAYEFLTKQFVTETIPKMSFGETL